VVSHIEAAAAAQNAVHQQAAFCSIAFG